MTHYTSGKPGRMSPAPTDSWPVVRFWRRRARELISPTDSTDYVVPAAIWTTLSGAPSSRPYKRERFKEPVHTSFPLAGAATRCTGPYRRSARSLESGDLTPRLAFALAGVPAQSCRQRPSLHRRAPTRRSRGPCGPVDTWVVTLDGRSSHRITSIILRPLSHKVRPQGGP